MVILIQFPNRGAVLKQHYTHHTYLRTEAALITRDKHKYGEFDKIIQLRHELAQEAADQFLR